MNLDLARAVVVMFRQAGHGKSDVVYRAADGKMGGTEPVLRAI